MRSSAGFFLFTLVLTALASCYGVNAQQSEPVKDVAAASPFPALAEALSANDLEAKGKVPFHLKLKFQVFDLGGKPVEQGSLDYWWAGSEGSFIEITSPSLGTLHSLSTDDLPNDDARRSLYLIRDLLNVIRHPYGTVPAEGKLISTRRTQGNVVMNCMHVEPEKSPGPLAQYSIACVDTANGTIRIVSDGGVVSVRNRVTRFGMTSVALQEQISMMGRPAITGDILLLEGFDPKHSPVLLNKPPSRTYGEMENVTHGKVISQEMPTYLRVAREHGISGAVSLFIHISEAGTVTDLVPIASADPLLTASATDAVQRWRFQPFQRDGKPVPVDVTVVIHFIQGSIDSWH